jgi:hypothetical protein
MADDDAVLETLKAELAAIEADASVIRKAIAVWEKRHGRVRPTTSSPRVARRRAGAGTITAHIMEILPGEPSKVFDAFDVMEALLARGWSAPPEVKDPINGVRTALARLAERGEIRRVSQGMYQAASTPDTPNGAKPDALTGISAVVGSNGGATQRDALEEQPS